MKKRFLGKRKWKALLMCLLTVSLFTGCGASSYDSAVTESMKAEDYYVNGSSTTGGTGIYTDGYEYGTADGEASKENVQTGRKLIKTANLSVETMEFDGLLAYIEQRTAELGGYIESMNVHNGSHYDRYYYSGKVGYYHERSANLVLRIPEGSLGSFLTNVEENSNIVSRSENIKDVTLQYVDLDSHKKVLETERDRLLVLMENATTIEDLIVLESRLSDVRYQIETMESQLRTYDNQIDYSTVKLDVSEVVEYTHVPEEEQTVGERIAEGFGETLSDIAESSKEFFIWFVVNSPYLVIFAVVICIGVLVIRLFISKTRREQQRRAEEYQKAQMEYSRQMQQAMQQEAGEHTNN